jgi:hypothetical protein
MRSDPRSGLLSKSSAPIRDFLIDQAQRRPSFPPK